MTPENGATVLVFSLLTSFFTACLGVLSEFPGRSHANAAETLIGLLRFSRQAFQNLSHVGSDIGRTVFGLLVDPNVIDARSPEASCTFGDRWRGELPYLHQFNDGSDEPDNRKAVYRSAIITLEDHFNLIIKRSPRWATLGMWPIHVSEEFFQLVEKHDPFALVLLAHNCIPLFQLQTCWYNIL